MNIAICQWCTSHQHQSIVYLTSFFTWFHSIPGVGVEKSQQSDHRSGLLCQTEAKGAYAETWSPTRRRGGENRRSWCLERSQPRGPRLPNGHRYSDGSDNYSDSDDSQTEFVRAISIPGSLDGENKEAQQFFDKMDKDLHTIIENTRTHKDSLEEVTSVLKETRFRPLAFPKNDCPSDGATMGCTFRVLMIVVVVFLIVIPIFGVVYLLNGKSFHIWGRLPSIEYFCILPFELMIKLYSELWCLEKFRSWQISLTL